VVVERTVAITAEGLDNERLASVNLCTGES
jgi:hypothetical protein